ncbi:MAG: tetratricopeptide repeat protein, partial [Thermoanaerobaculia bacterium]
MPGRDDKPPVTGGAHRLPFGQLDPFKFEELCLWLVGREGYERAEHLGQSGSEQGRDVVAWKSDTRFAFQCKRVEKFGAANAKAEIRKIRGMPADRAQPDELVFVVTAAVSDTARNEARLAWGDEATCHFWAGSELDERVKRHPDIVAEFFQITIVPSSTFAHNLPYSSLGDLFKGRDAVLSGLDADPGRPTAIVQPGVIHGLGGIGKTRLAVEYAWRAAERFPGGVFFVAAESPERLRASLAALAAKDLLALPERRSADEDEVVAAVLGRLRDQGGWLMILDNADTAEAAAAVEALLPRLDRGRVLVTSRWTSWGREVREQPLDVLDPEAARRYLLDAAERRQPRDDDAAAAGRLARLLGGLPLALEQAAAYVERYRLSFAGYLEEWEAERERVLEWYDGQRMHYPAPVAVTWQRTFDRLSPSAATVLRLASQLSPEPIPEGIFETGAEHVSAARAAVCEELGREDEEVALRDVLAELADVSLAGRDGGALTVHRVVQEVVRSRIPPARRRDWVAWTLGVVNAAAVGDPMDVRTWGVWDPLRPHVERIARVADAEGIAEPTARLMDRLATLLQMKALYRSAEELFRRAVEIERTAAYLSNLAFLLDTTNQLAEAEILYREALELQPEEAAILNNLAQLLQATNRLGEAEPLMRRALEIFEASLGDNHPNVAT